MSLELRLLGPLAVFVDGEDATPDGLGGAIADALSAPPGYRAVAPGGAARAAARIAELL